MGSRSKLLIIFIFALFARAGYGAVDSALSSYRLGSGDTITIRVLGEEDLRRERVRLSDAGTISFPMLGELKVAGTTVGDLERMITNGLKGRYLLNPSVTVSIDEYRPFFVNGQVQRPGGYPFIPGLTVGKAVALAGGFRERASMDKIFVVRDSDAKQVRHKVGVNSPVQPGDIVTVEESFF
jgi:protein involved in polysaccharide export with SLBB domain